MIAKSNILPIAKQQKTADYLHQQQHRPDEC